MPGMHQFQNFLLNLTLSKCELEFYTLFLSYCLVILLHNTTLERDFRLENSRKICLCSVQLLLDFLKLVCEAKLALSLMFKNSLGLLWNISVIVRI